MQNGVSRGAVWSDFYRLTHCRLLEWSGTPYMGFQELTSRDRACIVGPLQCPHDFTVCHYGPASSAYADQAPP
jgi:hypothetical protein